MPRVCLYSARYPLTLPASASLGLGYVASQLLRAGFLREDEILVADSLQEAIAFQPDILGVSSVSQVLRDAQQFASACKQLTGCVAVLGGYHVTAVPDVLPEPFDIAVIGEGDHTFAEIVENLAAWPSSPEKLRSIRGIRYRLDGAVIATEPRGVIRDVDALPWPLRQRRYSEDEAVITSRGCPYRCTYCASNVMWGRRLRLRGVVDVVDEIEHLVHAYQPREIDILDDLWMADKKRMRAIVDLLIARRIPERVSFRGFCRSNVIHEEEIALLKKMNYSHVRFGAETGSQRLLQRIKGDNISIADHQRVIDLCARHGLPCCASFMFGVPGETLEDLQLTVEFLRRNHGKLRIAGFYLCNPLPGTRIWDDLAARGRVSPDLDFSSLQLDFLNREFRWDGLLYFNGENVPLEPFREIITAIRREFVAPVPPADRRIEKVPVMKTVRRGVNRLLGSLGYELRRKG